MVGTVEPVSTPSAASTVTRRDAEQWREVAEWKERALHDDVPLLGPLRSGLDELRAAVTVGLRAIPGVSRLDDGVQDALHQLAAAGAGAGANTLRREVVLAAFRAQGHDVTRFRDIRRLEITDVRAVMPRLEIGYVAFAGLQGGVTSFLTSSGAAAAAGGTGAAGIGAVPGVAVVAGALAGDALLTVATCTRAVAHVAAYHGYDVTKRSEQILALAVLAVGLSSEADAPEAYDEVSSLIRTRAKDKERKKRQQRQLQRLAGAVHKRLLGQIGQRELAQLVPVVGIGIGALLSARLLAHVVDAAEHLYRERFLHEKYDLPFGVDSPLLDDDLDDDPAAAP